jgi:thiol-disulfide isomerase/thioredoxin
MPQTLSPVIILMKAVINSRGSPHMKRTGLFTLLLLFVLSIPAYAVPAGDLKWFSLKDGIEKAREEKKIMIVDFFYGKGCPRCEMLERDVYSNPEIAKKINDEFIPIFIDLSKPLSKEEEDLGNKFDYKKDCLLLFLDPDMNVLKDPSGRKMCFVEHVEPEVFMKYLDSMKKVGAGK